MFMSPVQHGIMALIKRDGKFVKTEHEDAHTLADIKELVEARVIVETSPGHYVDARNA
jgi:hypothetical protein